MEPGSNYPFPAFALFAFVTSITPGPNNMMLLASGVNFGLRASMPHIAGISCGFFMLLVAVGMGLAEVFKLVPAAFTLLKFAGGAYLLYLAWKVATAAPPGGAANSTSGRPLTFMTAAAFQWANPKAWVMAVTAFSTYTPESASGSVILLTAAVFAIINAPSVGAWAMIGSRLRLALKKRKTLLFFNYSMATLLIISLYPLFNAN